MTARLNAPGIEQLPAGDELYAAGDELRNQEADSFHGVRVAGRVMQEDDLAVPNLRENAVDPCLNAGFRDPVLTAGAADEGQIHLIKERIADGDVGWAEEAGGAWPMSSWMRSVQGRISASICSGVMSAIC